MTTHRTGSTIPAPRTPSVLARLLLAGALSMAPGSPLVAQISDDRAELLVEPAWLMENLDRADLVIVHVAGNTDAVGTAPVVPGSAVLSLDAFSINSEPDVTPRVRLDLPADLDVARAAFEAAGVSDDSRIVITYDGGAFPNATRTVWTLQFLGFDDGVSILHGGIEGWQATGGEVTTDRVTIAPGEISRPAREDRRVDARWVLDNGEARGIALLDARRRASWTGERPEMPGRAGHIPGAGSLPQVDLYDAEGRLLPESELRALFAAAGWEEGDQVVAYCHIGYWASAVVFAARTLGIDARLYDGSMAEWAQDETLPLVTEPGGGER